MPGDTAEKVATDEWLAALIAFERDRLWNRWRATDALRSLLCKLHKILHETPENLLQRFNSIEEATLDDEAKKLMCHMDARAKISTSSDPVGALFSASSVLRALDELLKEAAEYVSDEAPECWLAERDNAYVIPVPRAVLLEGGARIEQTFVRRGLLHHRIIPVRIGGVDVVVDPHPDVSCDGALPRDRTFGAALFSGFTLEYDERPERKFLVREVNCKGGIEEAIEDHCNEARKNGCDTLIWPELTITPESVEQIQADLGKSALTGSLPPVAVAGSWHVTAGDSHLNLAKVLSGRGEELLEFGKNRLFSFGGLTEDVKVYGKVHVLVTDRELLAFAICKDFCDKAPKPMPVTTLDVDAVLVPSMGQYNTMTSHRDAADDIKVLFGARSAVVQQKYPPDETDTGLGYVLKALKKPREAERKNLVERTRFTTFQREP